MTVSINGTSGIVNDATDLNYTGTLTGGTGVVNLGSGQVYKDASGNVGIGTTAPQTIFNGFSASARGVAIENGFPTLALSDTANASYRAYIAADGGNAYFWNVAAGPTIFATSDTERARIDSSGNMRVGGATGSTSRFQILADSVNAPLCTEVITTSSFGQVFFRNPNGVVGNISSSGSSTTYNTSSDYRLKEDFAPMANALAKVALLKPCTYKWKVDGSDGQGFIAHELAEVVAGCVTGEKDAVDAEGNPQYQGIDTSFLVATLAAAIQELKAVVDAQAARITALEGTAA